MVEKVRVESSLQVIAFWLHVLYGRVFTSGKCCVITVGRRESRQERRRSRSRSRERRSRDRDRRRRSRSKSRDRRRLLIVLLCS